MYRLLHTLVILLLLTGTTFAATLEIDGGITMELSVPDGWTLYKEAPIALLEEAAEHIAHEAAEQGASPTHEQLIDAARKRMAANEAILYHEQSGAHLDIDFSTLDEGQKAPSSRTLRKSAKYAAQSLEGEEGVSDVAWDVDRIKIRGARDAYLLSADYKHHDHPVRFLGVIGFVPEQWFFFYYTDPLKAEGAYAEMQAVIDSILVRVVQK